MLCQAAEARKTGVTRKAGRRCQAVRHTMSGRQAESYTGQVGTEAWPGEARKAAAEAKYADRWGQASDARLTKRVAESRLGRLGCDARSASWRSLAACYDREGQTGK